MMLAMSHKDYKYRPHSDERRKNMSVLAKRRLGNPDGYSTVYGCHVPDDHVERVRSAATAIAGREGKVAASSFVYACQKNGWQLPNREWTERDINTLNRMRQIGRSAAAIGLCLGRTRNSILGKIHRIKGQSGSHQPPTGRLQVPANVVREMISAHFEVDNDMRISEMRAGMFLVAPMFGAADAESISIWTGLKLRTCLDYCTIMNRAGLWDKNGPLDMFRYAGGNPSEEQFLTIQDFHLIMDVLLLQGRVRCEGDLWFPV